MTRPHQDKAERQRTRRRLSKELIVDASIRHLRRVGSERFSIRGLARELGVTPMAVYRHVSSKQALMDDVRESLLSLVPLVVETDRTEAHHERTLSEKEVVERALLLVRERGLTKLNMRALAKELGVSPMAIYRHLPNKQALLSRMTDTLIEQLPVPPPVASSWEENFRAHALEVWQQFSEYPGLVGSFASGPTQTALQHMAYERSILLSAGIDEHTATRAATAYHTFLLGLFRTQAYLDFLARGGDVPGVSVEAIRRYGDRIPLTDILSFFLDALVAGLRARQAMSEQQSSCCTNT